MIRLPLHKLTPGMVVAMDVKDRCGRILVAKQALVAEAHLKAFKMWGITHVSVVVDSVPQDVLNDATAGGSEGYKRLTCTEKSLARLFALNDSRHPLIQCLQEYCHVGGPSS